VLLYFPHNGTVQTEFLLSLLATLNDPASRVGEMRHLQAGPLLGAARNQITTDFLAYSPWEWLWMVDSDMIFTPKALGVLLAAADPVDRPVMGALCWIPGESRKLPTMYKPDLVGGRASFSHIFDYEPGATVRVAATGAACLLLHRSVFKRLEAANGESAGLWWSPLAVDGQEFGEDFSFCIRCADAGIPVHVCTGAETGHVKAAIFGRAGPA